MPEAPIEVSLKTEGTMFGTCPHGDEFKRTIRASLGPGWFISEDWREHLDYPVDYEGVICTECWGVTALFKEQLDGLSIKKD